MDDLRLHNSLGLLDDYRLFTDTIKLIDIHVYQLEAKKASPWRLIEGWMLGPVIEGLMLVENLLRTGVL